MVPKPGPTFLFISVKETDSQNVYGVSEVMGLFRELIQTQCMPSRLVQDSVRAPAWTFRPGMEKGTT